MFWTILSAESYTALLILSFLRCPFADPLHKLRASAQDSIWPSFLSFLRFGQDSIWASFFVILTLSEAKGKNLHMRPFGLRLRVTEKRPSWAQRRISNLFNKRVFQLESSFASLRTAP